MSIPDDANGNYPPAYVQTLRAELQKLETRFDEAQADAGTRDATLAEALSGLEASVAKLGRDVSGSSRETNNLRLSFQRRQDRMERMFETLLAKFGLEVPPA